MPETAVAEPIVEEAPIAEPVEAAPPTPEPETVTEGDAVPEAEGEERTIPEGLDTTATEAWLQEQREAIRAEEQAKAQATADARTTVRTKEMDEGKSTRFKAYDAFRAKGGESAAALLKAARDGDFIDEQSLNTHMDQVFSAAKAMAYRDTEDVIAAAEETFLPDLTPEEDKTLDESRYDFLRNGNTKHVLKVTELVVARKDAEIADLKKRLGEREELKTAAAKLQRVHEAVGPSAGAATPIGSATKTGPLSIEEAQNLPIEELIRRSKAS